MAYLNVGLHLELYIMMYTSVQRFGVGKNF